MRRIMKGQEPPSLTEHRERKWRQGEAAVSDYAEEPRWSNYTHTSDARERIRVEQRAICAFCQSSIGVKKTLILAHVVPQSDEKDGRRLEMDWTNIVGSCRGGDPTHKPEDYHCDRRQGSRRLSSALDPVRFTNGSFIYSKEGEVFWAEGDPDVQDEIDKVLGLNRPHLKDKRRAALAGFLRELDETSAEDTEAKRRNALELLDPERPNESMLMEYADYLLFHLREGELMSRGAPAAGADSSEASPSSPAGESS